MKLKMNHYDYLHLSICAALLFAQLATSLDICTLPTVANTSQSQVKLPVRSAEFNHRVLINDHYHLSCPPVYQFIVEEVAKEKYSTDAESSEKTKVDRSCPIVSKSPDDESHPFVHRAEVDVGFAGDQLLKLHQQRTIKWVTVGGNLSLMALYRAAPLSLEGCFLTSGLFEVGVAIGKRRSQVPTSAPLAICRSAVEPFRLGLLSMLHGGGVCTFLELPEEDDLNYPKMANWTHNLRTYLDEPIQLAVRQKQEFNYSWAEVPLSNLASGHWIAPPNAVEVEIGQSYRLQVAGGDYSHVYRPLYIARLTVNASFATVIGLFGGFKLPLEAGSESKLELLVEDEALFQVQLSLSGHVNPENVLAKWWDETLNCKLTIGNKSTSAMTEEGEVSLVDIKVDSRGQVLVPFGGGGEMQVKQTSWKIFRKSLSTEPYWGPGHGGSLFPDDALFIGRPGANFRQNDPSRLPRHLCRTMFNRQYWYAGYLDHSSGRCIVQGTSPDNDHYQLLYSSRANQLLTTANDSSLVWRPFRQNQGSKLGAIMAGDGHLVDFFFDRRDQILFARLESFTEDDNQTGVWLYGTVANEENTFRYTDGPYDEVTREVADAEAAGVQVLALR